MNKLIIVFLSFAFLNIAHAQISRDTAFHLGRATDTLQMSRDKSSKRSKKMMMDELNLTKQQRSSIKLIQQNHKAQRESIMNNDSLTMDQKKVQLKELRKKTENDINSILTDEQRQKRKELKEQMNKDKLNNSNKSSMQEEDDQGYGNTTKPVN